MTEKNKGGRPLKFKTPAELQEKIDAYFKHCDEHEKHYTIGNLAVWLDCYRETISNYEKRDAFFDTIKKAREKIQAYAENFLYEARYPAGVIFNLKNNFGWTDKQELQHSTAEGAAPVLNVHFVKADKKA